MGGGKRGPKSAAAGAANLQRWRDAHPEGGALRHGAYSKHVRKRYTDARTTEGRVLRAVMDELRDDLGVISAGQALILGRVREKLIVLSAIGKHVDQQMTVITKDGGLLPCLRWGYVTYSEALRRDIELLYALARKTSKKAPNLAGYLAGKERSKC